MNWKAIVKSVAPTLGAALGGPYAGQAVQLIADKYLGKADASEDEVGAFISTASPASLLEMKALDYQFKIDTQRLGVDVFELEVKDRNSARETHKDARTPTILSYVLTLMVFVAGYAIFMAEIPEANNTVANLLFGALLAKWGDSIAYWYGTTKGSSDKNKFMTGTTRP